MRSTSEPQLAALPAGLIDYISNDIFLCIALQLQLTEVMVFAQTSQRFWNFFQPLLIERSPLFYVIKADENVTNNNLRTFKGKNPNNWQCILNQCVLNKVPGKEPCGREWKSISSLEYAAWIGDMFMVKLLLNYVPTEGVQQALDQLLEIKANGLEHGPLMAPFYALIDAYNHYETHFNQFKNWSERDDYCGRIIGGLQLKLSYFGLQWLCDNKPFNPTPNFDRAPRRSLILNGKPWDPFDSSLGVSSFLCRLVLGSATLFLGGVPAGNSLTVITFLKSLCQASSDQLDLVITSLRERITPTNEPQLKK